MQRRGKMKRRYISFMTQISLICVGIVLLPFIGIMAFFAVDMSQKIDEEYRTVLELSLIHIYHAAYILYQNGKRGHEPQGIAVHHGTRQHCNDAELLRPRYFPFRTGGNGTAASQGKNHHRGQAGSCGGKRRGNQGGISSTQNLLLLLLLLRVKT